MPVEREYAKSALHNYVIKLDERDRLNLYLQDKGISTGVHYIPNHHYRMYRDFMAKCPIADKLWKRLLTLPLYPDLSESDLGNIIKAVKEFI